MTARWFWRYDSARRMMRVARATWTCGTVGDGHGYSARLSLALRRKLYHFRRSGGEWDATLFGVRLHYRRSYGGVQV